MYSGNISPCIEINLTRDFKGKKTPLHIIIYTFLELKKKGGYKLPITGVSFCKLKQNEHELISFVKEWEDKVDIVTIQKFQPPSFEEDFSKFYTNDQYVKKEIDNLSNNVKAILNV